jgi:hypothetical protein
VLRGSATRAQCRLVVALLAASALVVSARGAADAASATPPTGLHGPNFTDLQDLEVDIDGRTMPLGVSGITYRRRTVASFDDPATPGHDGIAGATRAYLTCKTDEWSIGSQIFTVDAIAVGNSQRDGSLVARGAIGLDWGVRQKLNGNGVHTLSRRCDGKTVEDFGGTHHTAQWLVALGEAVYLLRASPFAADYGPRTERYVARMEAIARRLVDDDNWRHWETTWLVDHDGNLFTHKTYMMAAGLALTASLTHDRDDAARWAGVAEKIARRGMGSQRDNGVNPERGGYDVAYQMYGTWLAQLYYSTLAPGPLQRDVGETIDRAIAWMSTRVDDQTGQVDIGASTRVCNRNDASEPYEAADAVRTFLNWGIVRADRELIDRAVLIDRGAKSFGNPCPRI